MKNFFAVLITLFIIGIQNFCSAVEIENTCSQFHEKVFYPLVRMNDSAIEKKINSAIIAEVDRFILFSNTTT